MKTTFSFQTHFLPPPFSYAYVLTIESLADKYLLDFQIEYLDRDDFSEEMLIEEGANPDDYFEWSGVLPETWSPSIKRLLNQTELTEQQPENKDYLYLESDQQSGFVKNVDEVTYLLQEMMQAIYESAQKEAPLAVDIIIKDEKEEIINVAASFSRRELMLNNQIKEWDKLSEYLSFFENFQFLDNPFTNQNKLKRGVYITYGDGAFYKIRSLQENEDLNEIIGLVKQRLLS